MERPYKYGRRSLFINREGQLKMNTPLKMLLYILCIDLLLFLGQTAVHNINPDPANATLGSFETRLISQYQSSPGSYDLSSSNVSSLEGSFPGAQEGIGESDATAFADIWNTIRSWIFEDTPLGIILQIFGAPFIS